MDEQNVSFRQITEEEPEPERRYKKRRSAYKKCLIIYVCLLLLLIVGSQILLWQFLSSYQKGQCDEYASQYIGSLSEAEVKAFIAENIHGSDFSDRGAEVAAVYSDYFENSDLVCRRSPSESKGDLNVYKISKDGTNICVLEVIRDGSGAFGMPRWKTQSLSLDKAFADSVNPKITLYTPEGSALTVNGKAVEGSLLNSCTSPFANEFEKEKSEGFLKAELCLPYGEADIAAESSGKPLQRYELDGGALGFDIAESSKKDAVITVPRGSEVYINSVRLSTKYITGKDIKYPFLNPLEEKLEAAPKATEYTVKGLYETPKVEVLLNGAKLERRGDSEGSYFYAYEGGTSDYTLSLPENALVYVNGICVSDSDEFVVERGVEYTEVSDYKSELKNPTLCCVYSFSGLFFKPEITVKDSEGKEYALVNCGKNSYRCDLSPNAADTEEYKELGVGFAEAMMEYTFIGREHLNENFKKVLEKTRLNSKAYEVVTGSYSGMYWRRDHTIRYNDLHVDNFISFADNAFRCDVHYDVTGIRVDNGREDHVVGIYRLLYINAGNGWEVVELNLLNDEQQ